MNGFTLKVLSVSLLVLTSATAYSQVTTLTYTSGLLTGTASYLPNGFTAPNEGEWDGLLPTSAYSGTISGTIVLDGSLAANDLTIESLSFGVNGVDTVNGIATNAGTSFSYGPAPFTPFSTPSGGSASSCTATGSCVTIFLSGNSITGASAYIDSSIYHAPQATYQIGTGSDSLSYLWAGNDGDCGNIAGPLPVASNGTSTYTGGTINPCSLNLTSSSAGAWNVQAVAAPEMDISSAGIDCLALLAGGIVVLTGRRGSAKSLCVTAQ